MSTAAHLITLEEFMARPDREDDQREELIEGELIVSPSAKVWHAAIVDRIRKGLGPLERKGYVLANDFACILGSISMPAPDLTAVSIQRANHAEDNDGWLDGSPELVMKSLRRAIASCNARLRFIWSMALSKFGLSIGRPKRSP